MRGSIIWFTLAAALLTAGFRISPVIARWRKSSVIRRAADLHGLDEARLRDLFP